MPRSSSELLFAALDVGATLMQLKASVPYPLVKLLQGVPAKVNLIPYNENPGLGFQTTGEERAEAFREILAQGHVAAFIRANRGRDIAAACGQLANLPGVAA